MPHCIIEHSSDLHELITPDELMNAAFKALQASELFEINAIKIRTHEYAYFQCGHKRENFIHITVKILSGRNPQEKKALATLVLNEIEELPLFDVEITIEVQDMDANCYMKILNY